LEGPFFRAVQVWDCLLVLKARLRLEALAQQALLLVLRLEVWLRLLLQV